MVIIMKKKKLWIPLLTITVLLSGCSSKVATPDETISTQDFSALHDQLESLQLDVAHYMAAPPFASDYKILSEEDVKLTYTELTDSILVQTENVSTASFKELNLLFTFYDADNNILTTSNQYISNLLTGKTNIASISRPIDQNNELVSYDHFELQMKALPYANEMTDYSGKLDIKSNVGTNGYVLSKITNNSDQVINTIDAYALFYDEQGNVIGYSSNSFFDLLPASYDILTFSAPYDMNYDDIPFADYKIFITSALVNDTSIPSAQPMPAAEAKD
ncbi:MAG: hypothetical protein PHS74_11105 [Lachnospiraceae bacterium]|nr:hypothetical protein [Lachnospiraceae bacterium]